MEKDNTYYVEIPVKSYVYKYLIMNYSVNVRGLSDTISFNRCHEIKRMVNSILERNSSTYDCDNKKSFQEHRNKIVRLCIGKKAFEHDGFQINYTALLQVSQYLEAIVRLHFLHYVEFMYIVEPALQPIIMRYKKMYGYTEEDWPYESMSKMCRRKGLHKHRKEIREFFVQKMESFCMTELSRILYQKRISHDITI